jgi:hypothetical protein
MVIGGPVKIKCQMSVVQKMHKRSVEFVFHYKPGRLTRMLRHKLTDPIPN